MTMQIGPALAYKPAAGPKGVELINKCLKNRTGNWGYELKLDGSRYLSHFHTSGVIFTSRRISDVTEKYAEYSGGKLNHLNIALVGHKDTIADGELMSTSAAAMKEGSYMIFDVLFWKGEDVRDEPLRTRIKYRELLMSDIKEQYPNVDIHEVKTTLITNADEVRKAYKKHVAEGGEGFVLKNLDSPYLTDSRSRDMWIK